MLLPSSFLQHYIKVQACVMSLSHCKSLICPASLLSLLTSFLFTVARHTLVMLSGLTRFFQRITAVTESDNQGHNNLSQCSIQTL